MFVIIHSLLLERCDAERQLCYFGGEKYQNCEMYRNRGMDLPGFEPGTSRIFCPAQRRLQLDAKRALYRLSYRPTQDNHIISYQGLIKS